MLTALFHSTEQIIHSKFAENTAKSNEARVDLLEELAIARATIRLRREKQHRLFQKLPEDTVKLDGASWPPS